MQTLIQSIKVLLFMTIVLGGIYPMVIYAIGGMAFANNANGQLIQKDGKNIGSEIVGQGFSKKGYFVSRPSAAGANGYDMLSSCGSNLAPANKALIDRVNTKKKELHERFGDSEIPSDLILASGSGLDPHISKNGALYQVGAISKERVAEEKEIMALIEEMSEKKILGILGEDRVNVLKLNLALDMKYGQMK